MSFDTDAIERATFDAVPPQDVEEIEGFLLGLDPGTVGRAHSAVPLKHVAPGAQALPNIEARYAVHGLPTVFRIPRDGNFAEFSAELVSRGYEAFKPTLTLVGLTSDMARLGGTSPVELTDTPDADWASAFLREGFDPVDAASRLALLRRSRSSLFASVRVDGVVAAVGAACFSHGWAGVHGMRTLPARRGRGLAAQLMAAMARAASRRGIAKVFLQVEEGNRAALALYRRAGLGTAWVYDYWRLAALYREMEKS